MTKKLTKHGHSLALVIERGVLDLLKIDERTPLDISTDGRILIIAPVHDPKRRKQFEAALAKSHQKYGRMYKRLANPGLDRAA
jgi:antitoxin MazE